MAMGTIGLGAFGIALWSGEHHPLSLGLTLAGGALMGLCLARAEPHPRTSTRAVTMAIVPWGVLVEPDTDLRVLHWSAVRRVAVQASHSMHGGTPAVVASLVTVETERELFAGQTPGPAGLEGLTVHLDAYAAEAARPVALDLSGVEAAGEGATFPVMADLLRRAADLCGTAQGAAELGLLPGGYRTIAEPTASLEAVALLRNVLTSGIEGAPPADPRPLAAIIAVRLSARSLVPELLRLVSSPHPVVAAVAKAAAIRLGAARNRAGAIDEVAAFLFEEDYESITRWAEGTEA